MNNIDIKDINEKNKVENLIIKEAKSMIFAEGLFSLRLTTLAKKCKISTTMLYSIFPKKEDILVAIALHCFSVFKPMKWWMQIDFEPIEKLIALHCFFLSRVKDENENVNISTICSNRLIRKASSTFTATKYDKKSLNFWDISTMLIEQSFESKAKPYDVAFAKNIGWTLGCFVRGNDLLRTIEVTKKYRPDGEFCFNMVTAILVGSGLLSEVTPEIQKNVQHILELLHQD